MVRNVTAISQRGIAALVVAASRCILLDLTCANADAAPRYLALYDCAVWGGRGSYTPVMLYGPIAPGERFSISYGSCGLRLWEGLIVALIRPPRRRRIVTFGTTMIVIACVNQERGQQDETSQRLQDFQPN